MHTDCIKIIKLWQKEYFSLDKVPKQLAWGVRFTKIQ